VFFYRYDGEVLTADHLSRPGLGCSATGAAGLDFSHHVRANVQTSVVWINWQKLEKAFKLDVTGSIA